MMATPDAPDLLEADADEDGSGALVVLRRGISASPELRAGIRNSLFFALAAAAGQLVIPIAIKAYKVPIITVLPA